MGNESDEKQQNMEEESKLTDKEEENDASIEYADNNKGPITSSRTKKMENVLLLKANTWMSNNFNNDN